MDRNQRVASALRPERSKQYRWELEVVPNRSSATRLPDPFESLLGRPIDPMVGDDRKFRNSASLLRGEPPGESFGFWRMMYVSGVILSTIGFGDFVPVTDPSRFLVLVEGFAGVLTLGMFLFSLGEAANRKQVRSP